jgi:hypothetical protein
MYWVLGLAVAYYAYSSGMLTNLFGSLTSSILPTSTLPVTNAQGVLATAPVPGSTQVEAPAVYSHDLNLNSLQ